MKTKIKNMELQEHLESIQILKMVEFPKKMIFGSI